MAWAIFLFSFIVAFAVSVLATPVTSRLARVLKVVDRPNERTVSDRANMPLMGGVAIALGYFVGLAVLVLLAVDIETVDPHFHGLIIGSSLLLVTGAWDDRWNMRALLKLAMQILAASVAIYYGWKIDYFTDPVWGKSWFFPGWFSWAISLLWIVGITNAVNLIDGLDGLATGVSLIIAVTLAFIAWQSQQYSAVLIAVPFIGAMAGFLIFNFPPAKIFLGDTGALFIGFVLAMICLEGYRQVAVFTFLVPLIALAVPIIDTTLSVVRRIRKRQPIFSPDRHHLHHLMLKIYGTHREAVLSIYFITACFCMIAVSFTKLMGAVAVFCFLAVVLLTIRLLFNLGFFDEMRAEAENIENGESISEGKSDCE